MFQIQPDTPAMHSARLILPLALAALLLPVASAQAADYCVSPATGCPALQTFPATGTGVQSALNAATTDGDRVLLGTGTYTAPTTAGFVYNHVGTQVQILGQGTAQTILTGPTDTGTVLAVSPQAGSLLSDLGLRIPLRSVNPNFLTGLRLSTGIARRVALTSDPALNGANALLLGQATFEDGSVILPAGNQVLAVNPSDVGATVRNSTIVAGSGIGVHYDQFKLERSRVTALSNYAFSTTALGGQISDSVVVVQAQGGVGVSATTQNGTDAAVRMDHSTLMGEGPAPLAALYASASSANHVATVDVHTSIVRGFQHARFRVTNGATTSSSASTTYSNVSDTTGDLLAGTPGAGSFGSSHDSSADPAFADAATGDYRLTLGSPAVDAGDPAGLFAAEPAVDFTGAPRSADGNGDCTAINDMGAYEVAHAAPTAVAVAAATPAPTVGSPTAFGGSTSSSPYPGTLTYAWAFDDGGIAAGATVGHAFATAGDHSATLTVTDSCGVTGTPVTAKAAIGPAPAVDPPVLVKDTTRPVIGALHLTARRFVVGTVGTRTPKRTPRGTTLRFTLSEPAAPTITIRRTLAGHRTGKTCRPGAPRRGSRAKRCTVLERIGTLTATGVKGDNRVPFTGRVAGRALAAGAYVAAVTATDAAGNTTRSPATATFTVVRR
ncbi:MAG: repeat protein [Solirubrobacterales bacterium]|nr:repeat protein [Solirubrobacterales bacterium]